MLSFVLQRVLQAVFVLLAVTLCVAFLIRFTGDPAFMLTQESASVTEADLLRIRESLGLNQSFPMQYWQFISNLVQGELGQSFFRGQIAELMRIAFPATMVLALSSMAVSILLSIPFGIYSAVHKGGWADQVIRIFSLLGLSFPNFWLAMMFVLLLSVTFPIFPASGFTSWSSLIMPSLTMGIILTATNIRLMRTAMIETLSAQYIMVARAKGLQERTVIYKHALRNSAIVFVTYVGLQFGNLIGGVVIVELVFNWPGMGTLAIDAIAQRDYPILQACVSILAIAIVAVNLSVDLVYGLIDPRIRVK
ncbi:ABC transporter permease [Pseudovibrio sp. Ad26]|uniref:ABC transporter permease n=1 Tax=Pseudovibrio sp. Ad26 TaxID=989410 RepID=UPI0012902137|nr:ABC transporter permease [Pseudovibrio sp. Ad26]